MSQIQVSQYSRTIHMCSHTECYKKARFGLHSLDPTLCKEHKCEDTIDVMRQHPTLSRSHSSNQQCNQEDCCKQAMYGLRGSEPTYCKQHKYEDTVNLIRG